MLKIIIQLKKREQIMPVHYEKFPCKQHCILDDLNDSKIRRNLKYENHLHHILTDTGVSFVETDIKYMVVCPQRLVFE